MPGEPRDRPLAIDVRRADDASRRPGRRCRGRNVVRKRRRDLHATRGRRREVGPAHDHAPAVGIHVHELLVGIIDRRPVHVDESVWIRHRRDLERPHPRVPAIGRAVHAHRLRGCCSRELLDDDRRVYEDASAEVLDIRVAEHPRKLGRPNRVGAGRRELAAVDEARAAIVGIHEPGDRDRVPAEASEVVEPDYDVLPGAVDGNRRFRLRRRRAIRRRSVVGSLAVRLIHAETGLLEVLRRSHAGRQAVFKRRPGARGGVAHRRHPLVGLLPTSSVVAGAGRHPGPRGDRCENHGAQQELLLPQHLFLQVLVTQLRAVRVLRRAKTHA